MVVVERWTGGRARLLQAALRATNESFARRLGVGVRTVAGWHADPSLVPTVEFQAVLDTTLERASAAAQERFARLLAEQPPQGGAQALTVAVAVVQRAGDVLLVCRRAEPATGLRWQFPAGVVKPGAEAGAVAVSETLGETGVHAAVTRELGERVHPVTGVLCRYLLCSYVTGQARNADPLENLDVAWASVGSLARFIPLDAVYPPITEPTTEPDAKPPIAAAVVVRGGRVAVAGACSSVVMAIRPPALRGTGARTPTPAARGCCAGVRRRSRAGTAARSTNPGACACAWWSGSAAPGPAGSRGPHRRGRWRWCCSSGTMPFGSSADLVASWVRTSRRPPRSRRPFACRGAVRPRLSR